LPSIVLRSTITVRASKKLLANIRTTEPGDIPCRLAMLDAAARIPTTAFGRILLFVLTVQVLPSRLAPILTVETYAIEVSIGVGLRTQNDRFPVNTAAALALRGVVVLEGF
jgi:hypothetical protein